MLYSIGFIGYYVAMISQKARYALRALLFLAARGDDAPGPDLRNRGKRENSPQIPGSTSCWN